MDIIRKREEGEEKGFGPFPGTPYYYAGPLLHTGAQRYGPRPARLLVKPGERVPGSMRGAWRERLQKLGCRLAGQGFLVANDISKQPGKGLF